MKLKILTFNIQHCKNYISKEIDVNSVVSLIKETNADIIGLNEVYGAYDNKIAQYEEIANKLNYYYYFGKAIDYKNIPYGNALISRFALKNPTTIMIPDPEIRDNSWYETRCIIKSSFSDFTLNVLVTHFGLFPSEQLSAFSTTLQVLNDLNFKNIVFMGDLNLEPKDKIIQDLEKYLINTLGPNNYTYPSINPMKKIDYIFVSKEIKFTNSKIINKVVSDHLAHYVEIEI